METNNFCILITGATGVGKTEFSLQLGEHLPIEIINADLGQFYQPLTIGTAKPAWKEQKIKHHLFDIFDTPRSTTVMEYRLLLQECMSSVWSRGNIPVIVGGSTLYIESFFFQPLQLNESGHEKIIQSLNSNNDQLWQELYAVDPQRALEIHRNDYYRLKRALDIWNSTGVKPSLQKPVFNPLSQFYFYNLTRERAELYTRINNRVISMIEDGWIDEVASLLDTEWYDFIMIKKFIGYPDLADYLKHGSVGDQKDKIVSLIAQKTRNYAKRQETYWKRLENKIYNCLVAAHEYTYKNRSRIQVLNLTSCDLAVYSSQQAKLIRNLSESSFL